MKDIWIDGELVEQSETTDHDKHWRLVWDIDKHMPVAAGVVRDPGSFLRSRAKLGSR